MIRSKKYLAGSRNAPCTFRIPGVCNGDWSTTVPCHIRDGNKGTGNKASDLSVANGCSSCHDFLDRRSWRNGEIITNEEWLYFALRGLQETLQQRFEVGLLIVPVDVETPASERPIKARKPKDQRTSIPKRKDPWGKRGWTNR